jgi:hypothetical protein
MVSFVTVSLLVPLGGVSLPQVFKRGLLGDGVVVAVVGSSGVFTAFHGVDWALPSALVGALVVADVVRRSGHPCTAPPSTHGDAPPCHLQ